MSTRELSYPVLMDILVENTRRFTRYMLDGGKKDEINACRQTLDAVIAELRRRREENPPGYPEGDSR